MLVKKSRHQLATEVTMVNQKPFGFARSALPDYKNAIKDVKFSERGELVMVAETEPTETDAARLLLSEQKSALLLQELVFRFIQPKDLGVDLSAETFSTALAASRCPATDCLRGTRRIGIVSVRRKKPC